MMRGLLEQGLRDPLLQSIRAQIEAKLDPAIKHAYLSIVVSGLKLMFSDETHQLMLQDIEEIKRRGYDARALADATLGLLSIIHRESAGKASWDAMFPAGIVLMCYTLEWMERTQRVRVTKELVAAATKALLVVYLKMTGLTQEQIAQAVRQGALKPGTAAPPTPQAGTAHPAAPVLAPTNAGG